MKVLISGISGKMGSLVKQEILSNPGVELVGGFDYASDYTDLIEYDVLIDFSHASQIKSVCDFAKSNKKPIVIATTGFSEEDKTYIDETSKDVPVFLSSNYSYGVYTLNEVLKKALSLLDGYDIEIVEKHHNQKVDAPSGTAKTLYETVHSVRTNSEMITEYTEKRKQNQVGMHSLRLGTIVGEHEISFASGDEIITLKHEALSKRIFAVGALKAAFFLVDQQAGLYGMEDLGGNN